MITSHMSNYRSDWAIQTHSQVQFSPIYLARGHDRLWENPAKVIFFRCQCLCVLSIYITCRVHHSISNILWVIYILKCQSWGKKWFLKIFEVWIPVKELYWNTINFNDIRCNFKALLNIFLHFGMEKMYQRGIFTKKFFLLFPLFSEFCLATLAVRPLNLSVILVIHVHVPTEHKHQTIVPSIVM
jgi:hypothetical protein